MLLEKIQTDLKKALKYKKELEVSTLRVLLSAIRNKEIELKKRGQLTDEEVVGVVKKQVKQHRESIEAYQKAKRDDLVDKETQELEVLGKYLPQEKSPKELEKTVDRQFSGSIKFDISQGGKIKPIKVKDFEQIKGIATKPYAEIAYMEDLIIKYKIKTNGAKLPPEWFEADNIDLKIRILESLVK